MHRFIASAVIAIAIALGVLAAFGRRIIAAPQLLDPNGEQLRFRLVGDEPIAGPDGHSVVRGWRALVFEDVKAGRCYVTFVHGVGDSVAGEILCADRSSSR
jgi:hypothetical protein